MNTTRLSMRALRSSRPSVRTSTLPSRTQPCQRLFHARTTALYAQKDQAPDGESVSNDVARMEETAFDPKTTDPDTQSKQAAQEKGDEKDNPLNMSAANPETRDWNPSKGGDTGSAASSREGVSSSGGGSPNKAGGGAGQSKPASGSRADE